MERNANIQAVGLYFHPSIINSIFSFENIRGDFKDFTLSEFQDQIWLKAFVERSPKWSGLLSLAPLTAGRIAQQIDVIGRELCDQRDDFWPCRSRSYLLELLFIVHRLYKEPGTTDVGLLSQGTSTEAIDKVILYLHTHYQEKISLGELAQTFHTNRTTLTRQFREVTNLPVMTY